MNQIFTDEQLEMLRAPLNTGNIRHKFGGLKYIKGDGAIDAANRIFGYGKWGYRVVGRSHEQIVDQSSVNADGTPTGRMVDIYYADVEVWVEGMASTMAGDGVGIVIKPFGPEAHEKARKEATTDALKRALRHFGDQFGLSLYDGEDWVQTPEGEDIQVKDVRPNTQRPPVKPPAPAATTQPPAAATGFIPAKRATPLPPTSTKSASATPDQIKAIIGMSNTLGLPYDLDYIRGLGATSISAYMRELAEKCKAAREQKSA
ncbi:MAG: hypothetical protein AUF65_01585 [Chloroflexi bacterium 13_1_20CM_50_12]|nr:MAG: hypothetical protein AUF65_01585 [Chloroflexi bacterium 13_1_20CM_50_12]